MTEAGRRAFEAGMVPHTMIEDYDVRMADLDGTWERDEITYVWHRRSAEFMAAKSAAEEGLPALREAAGIALAAVVIGLEPSLPPQFDGEPNARAPNGALYDIIGSGQVVVAGSIPPPYQVWATSGEAIALWRETLLAYVVARPGDTLWWRFRPAIDGIIRSGEMAPVWRVYSRLAIGNSADAKTDPPISEIPQRARDLATAKGNQP